MKLKRARKIIESKQIIYPKHEKEIERKIRILKKHADKKNNPDAQKCRNKAFEWEAILKANFWNTRKV